MPRALTAGAARRFAPGVLPTVALAVVLLTTASRYGFHGDELYFRVLPPAWWYDDQPPLTVWLSHVAARLSDAVWVQRLPAVMAACAGPFVAAALARAVGAGREVQRTAAWAHAFTVYPLLMGHVFLTASIDLFAWQLVLLFAVAALRGRPHALTWAGVVAGAACWNKLLVVVLVVAVVVALAVVDRRRLMTRDALVGAVAFAVIGAPQALAQLLHGMPMTQVSADLVTRHGQLNRVLVLPLLVVFLGPPLAPIWWRGLRWRPTDDLSNTVGAQRDSTSTPRSRHRSPTFFAIVAALVVVWNLAAPGQPYYAVAAFLPALAVGWGASTHTDVWRRRRVVIASNAVVAALLCLPIVPPSSPVFAAVAGLDPVARDQVGWPELTQQVAAARGDRVVITDSYALAGALARFGPGEGIAQGDVASGHNALWSLGPPREAGAASDALVIGYGPAQRARFRHCEAAGLLARVGRDPYDLAGTAMWHCTGLRTTWAEAWPTFRRLGG